MSTDRVQDIVLFSGSSHPELATAVAKHLGIPVSESIGDAFSNGERRIELHANVRRRHVYIVQTSCFRHGSESVNDYLQELYLMVNAAKLSDADTITVVIPNYFYARQDKKDRPRTPVSAKVVADTLQMLGVTRLVTMDLHSSQIQGFFSIPVDNLFASDLVIEYLKTVTFEGLSVDQIGARFVLVSPDAGGTKRVNKLANRMGLDQVLMQKMRIHSEKSIVAKTEIIGGSVNGRTCIIVDDMIDTGGTVTKACEELLLHGAAGVIVAVTHGVLSGPALERINACTAIDYLLVSDTIPQTENVAMCPKIRVYSVSNLLATCIEKIVTGGSISELFW